MNLCPENIFARSIAVMGQEAFDVLQKSSVAVFGIGGVGAACSEALARAGIGHLALLDHDTISPTNINRQLFALHSTLGLPKVQAARQRLLDINPGLLVDIHSVFYGQETKDCIDISRYDAVIDCMDTLSAKLLLALEAQKAEAYLLSSMGTGNRMNPGLLRFGDIYETKGCPLARRMRKACREAGISRLRVLYSTEEPVKAVTGTGNGRTPPGSVSFVPPVGGMMLAGEAIRHLILTENCNAPMGRGFFEAPQ